MRCLNGKHVEEHIVNLGNTLGNNGKMKKKSFSPLKLKKNKSKAPWAFPLAERKTNPFLPHSPHLPD